MSGDDFVVTAADAETREVRCGRMCRMIWGPSVSAVARCFVRISDVESICCGHVGADVLFTTARTRVRCCVLPRVTAFVRCSRSFARLGSACLVAAVRLHARAEGRCSEHVVGEGSGVRLEVIPAGAVLARRDSEDSVGVRRRSVPALAALSAQISKMATPAEPVRVHGYVWVCACLCVCCLLCRVAAVLRAGVAF